MVVETEKTCSPQLALRYPSRGVTPTEKQSPRWLIASHAVGKGSPERRCLQCTVRAGQVRQLHPALRTPREVTVKGFGRPTLAYRADQFEACLRNSQADRSRP